MNGNSYSFREHDPDLFAGNPDLSFIRTMSTEKAAENVSEIKTQYGGNKRMEKMNFDEFKAWAAEEIRGWLPESYADAEIQIRQVEQLGKSYTGMTVRAEDQIAVPTINLNDFFQEYASGRDTDGNGTAGGGCAGGKCPGTSEETEQGKAADSGADAEYDL